jgi:hypothetical protein
VSAGRRSNLKGHGSEAAKRLMLMLPPLPPLPPLPLFAYFLQGHLVFNDFKSIEKMSSCSG